jgi:hypothetical protein
MNQLPFINNAQQLLEAARTLGERKSLPANLPDLVAERHEIHGRLRHIRMLVPELDPKSSLEGFTPSPYALGPDNPQVPELKAEFQTKSARYKELSDLITEAKQKAGSLGR